MKVQEDKLKLASVELKKKLQQSKTDLENQYQQITRERDRLANTLIEDRNIILMFDQFSKILFINHSAENFFGVKSVNVLGQGIKKLFPGDAENYDSFIVSLFKRDSIKITGEKKKVRIPDKNSKIHTAEIHLTMAEQKDEVSYTVFISIL